MSIIFFISIVEKRSFSTFLLTFRQKSIATQFNKMAGNERYLVYDEAAFEQLSEKELELLDECFQHQIPYDEDFLATIAPPATVAFYLSDDALHQSILAAKDKDLKLAFLPHPEAQEIANGFGVNPDLQKALEEFKSTDEVVEADLLMCNGKLVYNYLVIGDVVTSLTQKKSNQTPISVSKRVWSFLKKLRTIKPKHLIIKADDKEELDTAVSEILITQHGKNSVISRLILKESYLNDGLFHILIFSPRSIVEVLSAYLKAKFNINQIKGSKKFDFLGHIKTNKIEFSFDQEISYTIDGKLEKNKRFEIEIDGSFQLIPTKEILFAPAEKGNQKIYKVHQLPKGDSKEQMLSKRLPFISHASTDEYKELFTTLRENAKTQQSYLILMVLSTVLATFGLFANSTPVIIGAMILAPLISPVISLSMGVLRQDKQITQDSLITIGSGIFYSYLAAILLTLITPLYAINSEIGSRLEPNLLDLGVAVVSGMAGAYAHANTSIAKTLAGVAIAVALVPPLAVSAIGVGWGDWNVFFGAFLLLVTNLTGMVLAGSFTFLLMGYSPFRIAKKGLLISLLIVLGISVPLGYGFVQVVKENKIVNSVNGKEIEGIKIKNVEVLQKDPLRIALKLVADHNPSDEELDLIKKEIETILDKSIDLEISFSLKVE
ncbi:MAG: DUF389 domain-containing protein [Bacteroidota bacterium]